VVLRDVCLPEMAAVKVGIGFGAVGKQAGIGAKVSKHMASVQELNVRTPQG
jgi:hypothetical protein